MCSIHPLFTVLLIIYPRLLCKSIYVHMSWRKQSELHHQSIEGQTKPMVGEFNKSSSRNNHKKHKKRKKKKRGCHAYLKRHKGCWNDPTYKKKRSINSNKFSKSTALMPNLCLSKWLRRQKRMSNVYFHSLIITQEHDSHHHTLFERSNPSIPHCLHHRPNLSFSSPEKEISQETSKYPIK